jgi:hypothetical protein
MHLRNLRTALPALLITLLAHAAAGQATASLSVRVLDQVTGRPVPNARVDVPGVRMPGRTGHDGTVQFDAVPVGNRIVTVSRLGYSPTRQAVDFDAGSAVAHTFSLQPEAVSVTGVSVRADRRDPALDRIGFYERLHMGGGSYLSADRIFDIRPSRTLDLFRHVRGFAVNYDRRGNPYLTTTRGASGFARQCTSPLVYVDGMKLGGRGGDVTDAIGAIEPEDIAAIEAYAGPASIPAQYNPTGSACGAVLIWMRHGPS